MNKKIKNALGISITATLTVLTVAAVVFTFYFYQLSKPTSFRSFSVSADSTITTTPDIAEFTFTVITEGGLDIAALQEENSTKINDALEFVKSFDVDSQDLKTQNFSIQPRYKRFSCPKDGGECPPAEIIGHSVRQSVRVKVRDFDVIGILLAGVVEKGANSVSQLNFKIEDKDAAENEARTEAIREAKEKAKAVAKSGGFRLGKLLSIQEGGTFVQRPFNDFAFAEVAPRIEPISSPPPIIEPGSEDVVVSVTLTFQIK
ncbi:hypothetical protein COB64_02160 [Candidatus Wolfebacteria bacterium]|nr:MAG: hypothetical protein COB64_02160 [Candidatus Wolfebacteria bacterium]